MKIYVVEIDPYCSKSRKELTPAGVVDTKPSGEWIVLSEFAADERTYIPAAFFTRKEAAERARMTDHISRVRVYQGKP